CKGGCLRLQLPDHIVDFAPRLTHLGFELLVQTKAEGLFTLPQRVFALAQARFCGLERLTLASREALLVLEGPHVVIDLRQVLAQLRLARAQVLPRGRNHRRAETEPTGHLACQAAPRRPGPSRRCW